MPETLLPYFSILIGLKSLIQINSISCPFIAIAISFQKLLPLHVNPFEQSARLNVLSSGTQYRICVIGKLENLLSSAMAMHYVSNMAADNNAVNQFSDKLVSSLTADDPFNGAFDTEDSENMLQTIENKTEEIFTEFRHGLMKSKIDTPISRCTEARTLALQEITEQNRLTDVGLIQSLLTRRLGLIVGCCLGILVFIVIVTILGWLKLKKRRIENAKRHEQQLNQAEQLNYQHLNHPELNQTQLLPPPPDYNNTSYRQFTTLPYSDCDALDNCNHTIHPKPPNCISGTVIGTTNIAC